MQNSQAMTGETVARLLQNHGAEVSSRSGRTENYSAPREFSFEVKGAFPNGLLLHVVARQYDYRDPWEAMGRVNEMVDVALLRDGVHSPLPKGYPFFQGRDEPRPCFGFAGVVREAFIENECAVAPRAVHLDVEAPAQAPEPILEYPACNGSTREKRGQLEAGLRRGVHILGHGTLFSLGCRLSRRRVLAVIQPVS